MYLYLDESGDLGFDFQNKNSSKFFIITLLVLSHPSAIKAINKAVSRTLDNKLNSKAKRKRFVAELKGSSTNLEIKKYFLSALERSSSDWALYSIICDISRHLRQTNFLD